MSSPPRRDPLLPAAATPVAARAAWTLTGLVHVWAVPALGRVPLPVPALLAAHGCRRVVR